MKKPDWTIDPSSENWECSWQESERFNLRYFKSLSTTEKLKAVEDMCAMVDYFAKKKPKKKAKKK